MADISLPYAHVVASFLLDGKEYGVENFHIVFAQPNDFKGQPQHETRGGQFTLVLTQAADDNLYLWAKTATLLKNGQVFFKTDLGIRILTILFQKAYCVNLTLKINASSGTSTTLIISPEDISLNGVEHTNLWPGK